MALDIGKIEGLWIKEIATSLSLDCITKILKMDSMSIWKVMMDLSTFISNWDTVHMEYKQI